MGTVLLGVSCGAAGSVSPGSGESADAQVRLRLQEKISLLTKSPAMRLHSAVQEVPVSGEPRVGAQSWRREALGARGGSGDAEGWD